MSSLHVAVSDEYTRADVDLSSRSVDMETTRKCPSSQPWWSQPCVGQWAEHRRTEPKTALHRERHSVLVARERVQDGEVRWLVVVLGSGIGGEKGAAVAAVQGKPAGTVGHGREAGGGGHEAGDLVEESQDGRCPVELAVAAAKAPGGQDAAPRLADSGGADEPGGLVRGKAEEDLLDELVHEDRRRRQRQRRR